MAEDLKYKKIMLVSVGTGRTGEDVANGIYFSINDHNPNYVYFILSEDSKKTTYPFLKKMLDEENPQINIELLENNEVNDVQKLYNYYSEYLNKLFNKGFQKKNITVDYTSGTKAMSAALVSAAISQEVGKLSYVYGDRGEGGRVKTGTERINSLSPSEIFSERKIKKAIELFNLYQYESALDILQNNFIHPSYKDKSDLLINLLKTYSAWDKFDFKEAFANITKIDLDKFKTFNLKGDTTKNISLLNKLKNENFSYEKIFDLLANAERRGSEGKYDDGMARLYRLIEMIAQIEFKQKFGCSTSDVKLDKMPEKYRENIKNKYYDPKTKQYKVPLTLSFNILDTVDNKIGKIFQENFNEIKKLLTQRNNSILAHGSVPISEDSFQKMFNYIKLKFIPLLNDKTSNANFKFPKIKI